MCGMSGLFSRAPRRPEPLLSSASAMVRAIRHRGPDGEGIWTDPRGHTALGHARLAIIDVTETGKQPMISRDGNFVLTLNGEIYNYVELRRELLQAGLKLRGTSDTEVLLEAMA